jgi:DNA ligase-1
MSSFRELAELGEAVAKTKKKLEQRSLIAKYLKSLPQEEVAIAARFIIGRVFPENNARILNVSSSSLSRVLTALAGEMNWSQIGRAVDYGEAVEKWLALQKHRPQVQRLELSGVYSAYEEIAGDTGSGSRQRKDARLRELFQRATPLEAKYLVKQVTQETRIGVGEGVMLDAIADASGMTGKDIRRANQVSGDLGEVARVALSEGERGLDRIIIRVGVPLKPMLAQSAKNVLDACEKLQGGDLAKPWESSTFALEYKIDGARVQIHKRGKNVRLYSRNLSDLSGSLPEIIDLVNRETRATTAVLEGEVIALSSSGRPRPFQDVMRRVGRERHVEELQAEIPVQLYLFDALVVEDEILLDKPNRERWQILQKVKGAVASVERLIPHSVSEAEAFLKRARHEGHEGLMAKLLSSPYLPGERGRQWLKIKPVITLDLTIVAADWGYGRRTGWLSNLHLAARDQETGELFEVGKTFKGLTDAEFKTLTEKLIRDKTSEKRGTVFVNPTVVVEVAFNNVQRSTRYKSGVALRLARVVNFRPDKSVDEIETVQNLREMLTNDISVKDG